jgi:hypothetical protein
MQLVFGSSEHDRTIRSDMLNKERQVSGKTDKGVAGQQERLDADELKKKFSPCKKQNKRQDPEEDPFPHG